MKQSGHSKSQDSYLEVRIKQYDKWQEERKVPTSSKVIPVRKSFSPKQWILPTEQVVEILRNARSFALTDCMCRSHYKRCDNPIEICFLINDAADRYVAQAKAKHITLTEAIVKLDQAHKYGLIHLTIYNPEQYVYAVCSCCTCCCHDLQFLKQFGRRDLIAHSEYLSQTNMDKCIHCGNCILSCVFEARGWETDHMKYNADLCYGCGLCVTQCPGSAIEMKLRPK